MPAPTAEEIAVLKEKHGGPLFQLEGAGETVVVRKPEDAAWLRFARTHGLDRPSAGTVDTKRRMAALNTFIRHYVIWPSRAEYEAALDRAPGLVMAIVAHLVPAYLMPR
jgi:hypothetical protein